MLRQGVASPQSPVLSSDVLSDDSTGVIRTRDISTRRLISPTATGTEEDEDKGSGKEQAQRIHWIIPRSRRFWSRFATTRGRAIALKTAVWTSSGQPSRKGNGIRIGRPSHASASGGAGSSPRDNIASRTALSRISWPEER